MCGKALTVWPENSMASYYLIGSESIDAIVFAILGMHTRDQLSSMRGMLLPDKTSIEIFKA